MLLVEGCLICELVDGVVVLYGLGYVYEGVEVLVDIDLELEDGSLVVLVGFLGFGKSILLYLLVCYMDV